jgi:hypothetical protein
MNSIQIVDRQSGKIVEAELVCDLTYDELKAVQAVYASARNDLSTNSAQQGYPVPQHNDWDWSAKGLNAESGSCRFFGIRYEGMMDGLIMLNMEPTPSRRKDHGNQPVLYVEFIETAPWNQAAYAGKSARFSGVGTQLIRIAIQVSLEAGCAGRIALHSLPQSEGFYQPHFRDLGIDPTEDLRYFEMDEIQARKLLEGEKA